MGEWEKVGVSGLSIAHFVILTLSSMMVFAFFILSGRGFRHVGREAQCLEEPLEFIER